MKVYLIPVKEQGKVTHRSGDCLNDFWSLKQNRKKIRVLRTGAEPVYDSPITSVEYCWTSVTFEWTLNIRNAVRSPMKSNDFRNKSSERFKRKVASKFHVACRANYRWHVCRVKLRHAIISLCICTLLPLYTKLLGNSRQWRRLHSLLWLPLCQNLSFSFPELKRITAAEKHDCAAKFTCIRVEY